MNQLLWVIQSKLSNEDSSRYMVDAFIKLGLSWAAYPARPFSRWLPDFSWDGPVFFYGSTSMVDNLWRERHSEKYANVKLFYDEDQFSTSHYGYLLGDAWLNYDAKVMMISSFLKEENEQEESFFFRPAKGNKIFSGGVKTNREMKDELNNLLKNKSANRIKKEDVLLRGPFHDIKEEYRTWIVDGKVIAAVGYKRNNKVKPWYLNEEELKPIKEFAENCANNLLKNFSSKIYVLDVAVLENGALKAIEINDIHASGWYLTDHIQDVVYAITNFINKEEKNKMAP